jgi:hypothetical protein
MNKMGILKNKSDHENNFHFFKQTMDITNNASFHSKTSKKTNNFRNNLTKSSNCLSTSHSNCCLNKEKSPGENLDSLKNNQVCKSLIVDLCTIKRNSYESTNDIENEENFIKISNASTLFAKTLWLDPDFLPLKKSLFMNGNKVKRTNLIHSNGFKQIRKWLRPFEINGLQEDNSFNVSLFLDPSPKDVIQGELGNHFVFLIFQIKLNLNSKNIT